MELSFSLNDDFVSQYVDRPSPFGFVDAGGNSIGELTFLRTYSRLKDDGTKERWYETCRRVIDGMYSIQKDWAIKNKLPWNSNKAQASAKEAYDRLFHLKWTPPGRGLWTMGSPIVHERGVAAALYNCSFVSTGDIDRYNPGAVFGWIMDALMLGVGVGFDTRGSERNIQIRTPTKDPEWYTIPDTREGWVESVVRLINAYLRNTPYPLFDYSQIRPAGEPIRGFGGTASGPDPLMKLHERLNNIFSSRIDDILDSRTIVDIVNLIGTCVVAGNVRRSATIALGEPHDDAFLNLKNYDLYPERAEWGWMSNNTITIDGDFDYDTIVERIADNGEPGILWLDTMRGYGRTSDPRDDKDWRVSGTNPCAEISLESYELCVSGDTRIQTKNGMSKIKELVGLPVEVWNGNSWSEVIPFSTGRNSLYRVTFSDGTHLDATPGHNWDIDGKKLRTDQLEVGMKLPRFSLGATVGHSFENAYEYGWFAGDGYIDNNRPMVLVQESEYSVLNTMGGIAYKEQHPSGYSRPFKRMSLKGIVDIDDATFLRNGKIPEHVFNWDADSILQFVAGLVDTDGTITNKNSNAEGYRIYAKETIAKELVMLLRRAGIDHATTTRFAKAGDITNYGSRNHDLWYVTIPSFEAAAIPTRVKVATRFGNRYKTNNAHQNSIIDGSRRQKIVSIELVAEDADTYCFNEPVTGMGVFGNVLTYQCNLVEVHLDRAESVEDFLRTIKFAYLFAKTVTLLPTHWPETNAVIQRNRRIGTSLTGIAGFVEQHGLGMFREWANEGYLEVKYYDQLYSEWLGVRESIRTTTVKPSGSVSLLSGSTPGVHWPPAGNHYLRAIRFANSDKMLHLFKVAGYRMEPDHYSDNTTVVYFPLYVPLERSERDVSIYEKVHLAAEAQSCWSDNAVSVTISFDPEKERDDVSRVLRMYEGRLKTASFLPMGNTVYAQQPYTSITQEEFEEYEMSLFQIDWSAIYDGINNLEAVGERYCSNDTCLI